MNDSEAQGRRRAAACNADGLKYWHIMDAVAQRGPAEKAARAVLVRLARRADSEGVSFPGIALLVQETRFSEVTVKRAIAALEFGGWIRVEERVVRVETARGFEKKGNRYRLNLVKLGLVVEQQKQRRDEGNSPAPGIERSGLKASDEGANPARQGRVGWTTSRADARSEKPVEGASARSHLCGDEVSLEARRGIKRGPPLKKKNKEEKPEGKEPPYAPPCDGGSVEIDCIEQHAASPQKQRQRQRLPDRGGGPANVIAFPRRQREPRTARSASPLRKQLFASVRETLDGEDAALWDEMVRVLRACGVDPETCGRKTRAAVLGALRVNSHDSAATIAGWGNLMVNRWREYGAAGDVLFAPVGFTRFVSEGLWLNPKLWRYNHERVREIRRGGW